MHKALQTLSIIIIIIKIQECKCGEYISYHSPLIPFISKQQAWVKAKHFRLFLINGKNGKWLWIL